MSKSLTPSTYVDTFLASASNRLRPFYRLLSMDSEADPEDTNAKVKTILRVLYLSSKLTAIARLLIILAVEVNQRVQVPRTKAARRSLGHNVGAFSDEG
jgi:hypothetical protein